MTGRARILLVALTLVGGLYGASDLWRTELAVRDAGLARIEDKTTGLLVVLGLVVGLLEGRLQARVGAGGRWRLAAATLLVVVCLYVGYLAVAVTTFFPLIMPVPAEGSPSRRRRPRSSGVWLPGRCSSQPRRAP